MATPSSSRPPSPFAGAINTLPTDPQDAKASEKNPISSAIDALQGLSLDLNRSPDIPPPLTTKSVEIEPPNLSKAPSPLAVAANTLPTAPVEIASSNSSNFLSNPLAIHFTASPWKDKSFEEIEAFLKVRGQDIGGVTFDPNQSSDDILKIFNLCPNLKQITFSGCRDSILVALIPMILRGAKLRHLMLKEMPPNTLTERMLGDIAKYCPNLRGIALPRMDNLSPESMETLAKSCPELLFVSIEESVNLPQNTLRSFAQNCPKLTGFEAYSAHVDTEVAEIIGSNWKNMRILSLNLCEDLTDGILKTILSNAGGKLTKLNIAGASKITDGSIAPLGVYAPDLETVNLSGTGISDISLRLMPRKSPKLKEVSLAYCHEISDEGIQSLASGLQNNLTFLALDGCNVTNRSLRDIGQHCKYLNELSLSNCNGISEAPFEGVFGIASECLLTKVWIDGCRGFSTEFQERMEDFRIECITEAPDNTHPFLH